MSPITVKVRHYGEEHSIPVYNNLSLDELLHRISEMTYIEYKQISLKVIEDTVIRRIDRKVHNVDNPTIKTTLRELKIVDNSALLVELKDPSEMEADEDVIKLNNNNV